METTDLVRCLTYVAMKPIADDMLEHYGDHYRSLCGSNDVLIHDNRIVLFEQFVFWQELRRDVEQTYAYRERMCP